MMTRRELLELSAAAVVACSASPRVVRERRVARTLRGMATSDGAGVSLMRIIGQPGLRHLDPFIMLDRFHSDDPSAYIAGFPDHPHRGFETVTVMLQGRMRHKDSKGNSGLISDGGIQWMTAGRGIVHSEMPEQTGGLMSGFQLWLNLPAREKMRAQEYQDLQRDKLVHVPLAGQGTLDLIAGRALDAQGPVAPRSTEPLLLTANLLDERPLTLDVAQGHTAFLFVHRGSVLVGADRVSAGSIAQLDDGNRLTVRADGQQSGILVAAAKPIGEPIAQRGPFVMNTESELNQAFDDYRTGKLAL